MMTTMWLTWAILLAESSATFETINTRKPWERVFCFQNRHLSSCVWHVLWNNQKYPGDFLGFQLTSPQSTTLHFSSTPPICSLQHVARDHHWGNFIAWLHAGTDTVNLSPLLKQSSRSHNPLSFISYRKKSQKRKRKSSVFLSCDFKKAPHKGKHKAERHQGEKLIKRLLNTVVPRQAERTFLQNYPPQKRDFTRLTPHKK